VDSRSPQAGEARRLAARTPRQGDHPDIRIILAYGCELGLQDCLKLAEMIDGMEFRKENDEKKLGKVKKAPKVVMTYAHAEAIVLKGIEIGTRRSRSVALAVAAQFEFTISQIDAMGHWMPARG